MLHGSKPSIEVPSSASFSTRASRAGRTALYRTTGGPGAQAPASKLNLEVGEEARGGSASQEPRGNGLRRKSALKAMGTCCYRMQAGQHRERRMRKTHSRS